MFKNGNMPPARQFCSFTPVGAGVFFIFGGLALPYQSVLGDLWVLRGVDKLRDTKTVEIVGCSCS